MKNIIWFFTALLLSGNVQAVDGVFAEYGNGNAAEMARAGAIWNWDKQWFTEKDWLTTGFWEASLGSWRGHTESMANHTITDIGITPVFRWQQKNPGRLAPYAEAAIGLHLISPTSINNRRRFSTALQFGNHVGAGVRFGEHQQFELGYRFQHLSNGSIKEPNQGINFNQVHLTYHFRPI